MGLATKYYLKYTHNKAVWVSTKVVGAKGKYLSREVECQIHVQNKKEVDHSDINQI